MLVYTHTHTHIPTKLTQDTSLTQSTLPSVLPVVKVAWSGDVRPLEEASFKDLAAALRTAQGLKVERRALLPSC